MTSTDRFLDTIGILELDALQAIMICLGLVLMYLAIAKKYEPLLLLPIAFGMIIANLPLAGLSTYDEGGLLYWLYQGIGLSIYPPLIFLCIGAMTDFGPLIANPRTALVGLGGQLGIFSAFGLALLLSGGLSKVVPGFDAFTIKEAASIGIIGSADGPTTIYTASHLAPDLLPILAVSAYSYMALIPIIQPPLIKLLTTQKERVVYMPRPHEVTRKQKILFPIIITIVTLLLVPAAGTLISMLMLGTLIRESGVVERFTRTLENEFLNILTLLIALSIGSTCTAERILNPQTLLVIFLGLVAFSFATIGGILMAKLLCFVTGGKVNPLIGNSGVSAMPMAARISQQMGAKYNPRNHLLMHGMGAMVSSCIGSALIAGIFISMFGG